MKLKEIHRGSLREERVVERLSALTKIDLTADEQAEMREHLRPLLAYIDRIELIDTENVPTTERVSFAPVTLRADTASAPNDRDRMLSNSANRHGAYLRVPKNETGEGAL